MSDPVREMNRKWVECWLRGQRRLLKVRRDELRAFNHAENVHIIDGLLQLGHDFAQPRPISGLVEQQRVFQKAGK